MTMITRRTLLQWGLAASGATLTHSALLATDAHAKSVHARKLRSIKHTPYGTTLHLKLFNAPFPDDDAPYTNSSVYVHVPRGFEATYDGRLDMLVHFHGFNGRASDAMTQHNFREQLTMSKRNALLIMPQGPERAKDTLGGKLDKHGGLQRLLQEVCVVLQDEEVQRRTELWIAPEGALPGKVVLSAHSGGFQVLANCLRRGRTEVQEVYLFDALYGYAGIFARWLAQTRHAPQEQKRRLFSYYNDVDSKLTSRWTGELINKLDARGIAWRKEEFTGFLQPEELANDKVVLMRTDAPHEQVPLHFNALHYCLKTSCFKTLVPAQRRNTPQARAE